MKMGMNLNTKCREAALFFLLVDGMEETHTQEYTYMQSGWIESPPAYMCVCCCVSSLMPVMDLFLFLLSLRDIFLPLVDLDLKKKNEIKKKRVFLHRVCKKELNTAPKEERKKKI